ncbi:hypothetical protein PWG15_26650 (plasmid) [Ensifer adhaerens]|uniref:hypothetical protein n=1 Tax=Ensifer adhaerens TaxID=106592 RepID=UPI0023A9AE3C|nr:hypothetical protein [Ensifer adhaerens]WDZ79067.1 hypothetical protein PWG15_26650 [Ensifer adhaerens]
MRRILLALVFVSLVTGSATAVEPERRDAIVVTGRVWDGFSFREMFLPSQSPALHLISGEDSALSFVGTEEYYWPLSRQVYVDLEKKREDVVGFLKITKDGQEVAAVRPSSYVVLYPRGAVNGDGRLLWGDAATAEYETYWNEERSFNRRYAEALARQTAYEKKLVEAGAARAKGGGVEIIPPPAALPEPSLKLVTKPSQAYRLALAAGRYEMALYVNDVVVAGTARDLDVVEAAGRGVLVGDVVPEERWTRPIPSNHEDARIFVRPGSTFYLTLSAADRFQEAEYLPVVSPQVEVVAGRDIWVRRKPAAIENADIRFGEVKQGASLARLKVEQVAGSGFGYRVRPAKEGEKEDLTAFAITAPSSGAAVSGEVSAKADVGVGFTRDIVIVRPRSGGLALGLAFLPLVGWFGLRLRMLGASKNGLPD